jgi:glycine hydroxymethyltransferase
MIPFDDKGPLVTSGIRLGTPAVTTRKMKEGEMRKIAGVINDALENPLDQEKLAHVRKQVLDLTRKFPLYPELFK